MPVFSILSDLQFFPWNLNKTIIRVNPGATAVCSLSRANVLKMDEDLPKLPGNLRAHALFFIEKRSADGK